MNRLYIFFVFLFFVQTSIAQDKFFTKEGYVSFFSHTIVEDIKADNQQVLSIVDTTTGEIAIQLLMRSFQFKKALMQEHFNENYMESSMFPKAIFKGKLEGFSINGVSEEISEYTLIGSMTVHGITQPLEALVKVKKVNNVIELMTEFILKPEKFNIKINGLFSEAYHISILCTDGRIIYEQERKSAESGSIPIHHLESGIYLGKVQSGKSIILKKLVVR